MTEKLFIDITQWQREIFVTATPVTAIKHLQEEFKEVSEALEIGNDLLIREEFADCFLLLFGAASLHGLDYWDVVFAIRDKFVINQGRQWGGGASGYMKHVDEL